jgi:hypothetical protein
MRTHSCREPPLQRPTLLFYPLLLLLLLLLLKLQEFGPRASVSNPFDGQ